MLERGSKTSPVPVVWTTSQIFSARSNDFLSRLVTMDETWLYRYNLETKQESMEWRHCSSPRPKKVSAKICWKISRLDFLGSRQHPPHWLCTRGPNYQRGELLISAGAMEGHFEGKMPWEGYQVGLVLAQQCPSSPGGCNLEETGLSGLPLSWSPILFSRNSPVALPPVPM